MLLNDIYSKLNSLPAIAEKIHNEEISVDELDVLKLKNKYNQTAKKQYDFVKFITEQAETENKKRTKRNWIIVGVIAGISAIILAIFGISKAVEEHNLDVKDRQTAHAVVLMIDDIGEVTLEDKPLLNNIKVSYGELTHKQKKYVSNYSVYVSANNQYNVLYKGYMEEYTADDPTRNITVEDLKGSWESTRYIITIGDLQGGQSIWYNTYDKQNERYVGWGWVVSETLPSSTIDSYDCLTQTKSGKLYHITSIGRYYENFTIKIGSDGKYYITIEGTTYVKK